MRQLQEAVWHEYNEIDKVENEYQNHECAWFLDFH